MRRQFKYWIMLFFLSALLELRAQSGSLPEHAMGARSYAMGQSALLSFSDAVAVAMNPSSIAQAHRSLISFFYVTGPVDNTRSFSVGLVHPTANYGSVGVSLFRLETTDIAQRGEQGELIGRTSFTQSHLLLSYGKNLGRNFSLGASAKFVSQAIGQYESDVKNIGMDVGIQYDPGFPNRLLRNIRIGVSIDNLIKPATKLAATREHLPREIRFVIEKRYDWAGGTLIAVGNLARRESHLRGSHYEFHAGLEYSYKNLSVRSGYRDEFWAVGIGFRTHSLIFNYALSRYNQPVSKYQNAFSLSFEFGSVKSR